MWQKHNTRTKKHKHKKATKGTKLKLCSYTWNVFESNSFLSLQISHKNKMQKKLQKLKKTITAYVFFDCYVTRYSPWHAKFGEKLSGFGTQAKNLRPPSASPRAVSKPTWSPRGFVRYAHDSNTCWICLMDFGFQPQHSTRHKRQSPYL